MFDSMKSHSGNLEILARYHANLCEEEAVKDPIEAGSRRPFPPLHTMKSFR